MIDYKQRQAEREITPKEDKDGGIIGDSRRPYHHEQRSPESVEKVSATINTFYKNKEQYEAFVRLVGKEEAMKWMATLMNRANRK